MGGGVLLLCKMKQNSHWNYQKMYTFAIHFFSSFIIEFSFYCQTNNLIRDSMRKAGDCSEAMCNDQYKSPHLVDDYIRKTPIGMFVPVSEKIPGHTSLAM